MHAKNEVEKSIRKYLKAARFDNLKKSNMAAVSMATDDATLETTR